MRTRRYMSLGAAMALGLVVVPATRPLDAQSAARGQAQTTGDVEQQRKLIRDVADSLRAKDGAKNPHAAAPKNWKPSRTPEPSAPSSTSRPARRGEGGSRSRPT